MIWAKIQLWEFPKRGLKKKIVTIYGNSTPERMRCSDRQSAVKKKGGGVLLYIPVKLAPKLRPDLNLFDKEKYESVWVECKSTFNISSKEKMLVNLCYNPSRSNLLIFWNN